MSLTSFLHDFFEKKHENLCYSFQDLEKAFCSLHKGYTSGSHTTMSLRTYEEMLVYIATRRPATYAVVAKVLKRFLEYMPSFVPSSILDIGSGPLTATHAAAEIFCTPHPMTLHCIESHPLFCRLIEEAITRYREEIQNIENSFSTTKHNINLYQADMTDDMLWKRLSFHATNSIYDMAIASYCFGELAEPQIQCVVDRIASCANSVVFIEPGTPRGWKTILSARSTLIDQEKWDIIAPCPHTQTCPFLLQEKGTSWCHETIRVERTRSHRLLKQGMLGYEDEPFSYCIAIKHTSEITAAAAAGVNIDKKACTHRIVHRPQHRSGHSHFVVCCKDGTLQETIISKKNKEIYSEAKKCRWGDALPIKKDLSFHKPVQ